MRKKLLFGFILLILFLGMIVPFVSSLNETNSSNETNTSLDETITKLITYDWMVSTKSGSNLINFENKKELQKNYLEIISASDRILHVDCVPYNDNNDLCDYLIYQQNVNVYDSENIIQRYDISLALIDNDRYASKLIFTDDNNISHKIVIKAIPKDEFSFDGTTTLFGYNFETSTLSLIISFLFLIFYWAMNDINTTKFILSTLASLPVSFIIYLILSAL